MFREILDPSYRIDPKFAVQVIVTVEGDVITGIIKAEDKTSVSILVNPEAPKPMVVQRSEIDEMIKTSGYRVSPTEIEEVAYASGAVGEAVALGITHPAIGQAIMIVATPVGDAPLDEQAVIAHCRRELAPFMVPHRVIGRAQLARNPNGKIDRQALAEEFRDMFAETHEEEEKAS